MSRSLWLLAFAMIAAGLAGCAQDENPLRILVQTDVSECDAEEPELLSEYDRSLADGSDFTVHADPELGHTPLDKGPLWILRDSVPIHWEVIGGEPPFQIVIDGYQRGLRGQYTERTGRALIPCSAAPGQPSIYARQRHGLHIERYVANRPSHDSLRKQIVAFVTDTRERTASASVTVQVLRTLHSPRDFEPQALSPGEPYRISYDGTELTVAVPSNVELQFLGFESVNGGGGSWGGYHLVEAIVCHQHGVEYACVRIIMEYRASDNGRFCPGDERVRDVTRLSDETLQRTVDDAFDELIASIEVSVPADQLEDYCQHLATDTR